MNKEKDIVNEMNCKMWLYNIKNSITDDDSNNEVNKSSTIVKELNHPKIIN